MLRINAMGCNAEYTRHSDEFGMRMSDEAEFDVGERAKIRSDRWKRGSFQINESHSRGIRAATAMTREKTGEVARL